MVVTGPRWSPPLLFPGEGFPRLLENTMDGAAFCLGTATMGTKFSMLHSITFLPFDRVGVSRVGNE